MIESILENELRKSEKGLTDKAVATRMSRARKAEELLDCTLDFAVSSDRRMYECLLTLRRHDTNGGYQNALRWYYFARNKREFPRLKSYEQSNGIL